MSAHEGFTVVSDPLIAVIGPVNSGYTRASQQKDICKNSKFAKTK